MEEYAGGLCEHHPEHDDECGYSEGIAGTACSHEHTDDCYKEVINCTHRHDEDCYPDEIIWDDEATPSDADQVGTGRVSPYVRGGKRVYFTEIELPGINMMMNVAIPPLPGEHPANLTARYVVWMMT